MRGTHLVRGGLAMGFAITLTGSLASETSLLARIDAEIAHGICSVDADCTTIPIGEKACGGPERWLACTRESAKQTALQALLGKLITVQKKRIAQSGMMSNCEISLDPGAMCRANRCVLRPTGSAI